MEYTNSYFSLDISKMGVAMKYFPPKNGGERLDIDDVMSYLKKNNIDDFDVKVINNIISQDEEKTVTISNKETYSIDEYMEISIDDNIMSAKVRFYPPSNNGSRISSGEMLSDLKAYKIVFGVDEEVLEKQTKSPEYMKWIIVAKGQEPVHGSDASIEYKFSANRKAKPQLNEDGTVDFHKLNNISHVSVGDVLAILHKEDLGKPGTDVFGNVVAPRKVNRAVLRFGNNIKLSEDGTTLTSLVDGHVTLDGDRVSVSNLYEVPADVDNSTGDIEYNGSVCIKGNVRTGFKVRAKGNVEIYGVVEGATIIADGDIMLRRGVQGMGRCQIIAGGNLISRFIESAVVATKGYVETDTILHSQVSAKGDIYVRGKNGDIIGGNVRSATLIEATTIGSTMGITTNVEVGTDPAVIDAINKLKKEITDKNKVKGNLTQSVMLFKQKMQNGIKIDETKMMQMQKTANEILKLEKEIATLSEEYEKKQGLLSENANAKINVKNTIYQGAKVTISGDYILIHSAISRCTYKKEKGEIKAVPL